MGLQGEHAILAEDPACLQQQPKPGWCETPVELRAPYFGLPKLSQVPCPVGGDSGPGPGLSRWGIPDDGLRLYSHPPPKKKE